MAKIMNDEFYSLANQLGAFRQGKLGDTLADSAIHDLSKNSLENHFLIAMPSLHDPFFRRSVTYICEHSADGAMGLVINNPIDINVGDLLKKIDIDSDKLVPQSNNMVFSGGPVQTDRGFVLHSPQPGWSSSLQLSNDLMVTTSKDILQAIANNDAPEHYLIALGYSGWTAGQLEKELAENSWLTIPASKELLFDTEPSLRWEKAAQILGVNMQQISGDIGHA